MMDTHWWAQLPQLADEYLHWKHGYLVLDTPVEVMLLRHEFKVTAVRNFSNFFLCSFHLTCTESSKDQDITTIHQCDGEPANVSLVRVGLLGCSSIQPSVAIDIHTLEFYYRLR